MTWHDELRRTVSSWSPDVLLVNPVKGAPGTRGAEASVANYADTVRPSYLYGRFHATFPAEPLYFNMIAAQLRRANISCEIVDGFCHRFNMPDLMNVVTCFTPRIVAFAVFHNTLPETLLVAAQVKKWNSDITVVIGSAYAAPHWKEIVSDQAVDCVVVGDGEVAFRKLAERVLSRQSFADLAGIASRQSEGPALTPPVPLTNLDELAFAARDLMPLIGDAGHGVSMYTTRGCAFGKCSFCYLLPYQAASLQPLWRARSAVNVVDEIEYLTSVHGIDRVTFVDEDYFGPNGPGVARALEIARLILERGLRIRYYANALVKSLIYVSRQGHLPLLAESGLDSVFAGFESVSVNTLIAFRKPQRPDQYEQLIDTLDAHQIRINPGLITFTPTATLAEIEGNIRLAERMRYYDLFLFTRRLVDLSAPIPDARTEAMAAPDTSSTWLESFRSEHGDVMASFADSRVASFFEMMRVLCNLLFESFQEFGDFDVIRDARSALIESHYAAFYRGLADIRSAPPEGLSFDEVYAWAAGAHGAIAAILHGARTSARGPAATASAGSWS